VPPIRILIAEDETSMRQLLEYRLSREPGFEIVATAEDGRKALALARSLNPDVVVMDLHMPHLNGISATEQLKSTQPRIRVILFSALEDLLPMGRAAGAFASLSKRQDPEELIEAIRRAGAATETPAQEHRRPLTDPDTLEQVSLHAGLTRRERRVVEKVVTTDATVQQIAHALSGELGEPVTHHAVRRTLERAMTKLQITPRTRGALVKHVLDWKPPCRA
jgi:DNA-binding NarL/FixJ family response regulator